VTSCESCDRHRRPAQRRLSGPERKKVRPAWCLPFTTGASTTRTTTQRSTSVSQTAVPLRRCACHSPASVSGSDPTAPQSPPFLAEEFRKLVATLHEKGFDKAIATQRQQMFGQDSMQVMKGKLVVRAHWSIRYPDSRFSLVWDSTQLLLLVWVMFSVSHPLAFLACIGSPCLRRGVHGDPITGHAQRGARSAGPEHGRVDVLVGSVHRPVLCARYAADVSHRHVDPHR
jgi:hypothetical protein